MFTVDDQAAGPHLPSRGAAFDHERLVLQARDVEFDWAKLPFYYVPNEPFATHFCNILHLLLPADLIADHIVELMGLPDEAGTVFNLTADDYYNIMDITRVLSERFGYRFTYHDIPSFAEKLNRRCAPRDPMYPLVDFLTRSADKIAAMRDKRYDNSQYRHARALAKVHLREPALSDTVEDLVRFLRSERLITEAETEAQCIA